MRSVSCSSRESLTDGTSTGADPTSSVVRESEELLDELEMIGIALLAEERLAEPAPVEEQALRLAEPRRKNQGQGCAPQLAG